MDKSNIFKNLPDNLDQEVFDLIAQNGQVKIERIISKGHTSPTEGWYDQEQNEWVIVLKGGAEIEFEGADKITLAQGDHVNIPAHTKHKVAWTSPDIETIWLAVHY